MKRILLLLLLLFAAFWNSTSVMAGSVVPVHHIPGGHADAKSRVAAPVAVADDYNVVYNTSITVNAPLGVMHNDIYDAGLVQGVDLVFEQAAGTQHGTLTPQADGSFTYTPTPGYSGDDFFQYYIGSAEGASNTVTVTIHVAKPSVMSSSPVAGMTTTYGTASAPQSFSVAGSNLSAGILVTAPAHFEVSLDNSNWFPSVTVPLVSGNQITATSIGVRLKNTDDAGAYSEDVTVSSQDADPATTTIQSSTVNPLQISVTPDPVTKTYGNVDPALTYSFTPSLVGSDAFSGALSRVAGEDVATYNVSQGSLSLSSNYILNYNSALAFTIQKRPITFTPNSGQGKIYGNVDPTLTYSIGGQGLAFADAPSGSLSRTAGENVGSYAILQGSLTVSAINYDITFTNGVLFAISPRPVTVTANAGQSKVYGSPDPALTYTVGGSGLAFADTFSGALGRDAGENAGAYNITLGTLAASSNYALTFVSNPFNITPATLTITASAASKTYGDADPALGYTVSGLQNGDVLTGTLTRTAGENVGDYTISIGSLVPTGGNYDNYVLNFLPNFLHIDPRSVTVTSDAGQQKTYGDADPVLTYTASPALVAGDAFSGALSRAAGENVGPYAITQGTLSAGANYALSFALNDFSIQQRNITVTANAGQQKVYGDADPVLTYTVGGSGLAFSDTFTGALTRVSGEDAGVYNILNGTLSAGANYNVSFVPNTFEITKAPLTITADAASKTYGSADPAFTYTATALKNGDTWTGSLSRTAGENAGTYPINIGTLAPSGGFLNYNYTFVPADLTIGQQTITVTPATGQSKTYGNADPALTYTSSPALQAGDSFTGALSRDPGENVGSYAITAGTLSAGSNYTLVITPRSFAINKRSVVVVADHLTKIYGDADPVLTFTGTPSLLPGDAFSGTLIRLPGENVGAYGIGQGSVTAGTNYLLSYTANQLDILPRDITITADPKTKNYGDADPALTYTVGGAGTAFADAVTGALTRDPGEAPGAYAINQGTVNVSNAGNYIVTYESDNLTITQKTITITPGTNAKVYGDADQALNYTFSPSLDAGDSFTGSLSRDPGENVGSYNVTLGSLSAGTKYTLVLNPGVLSIQPKPVTVTADAKSKTYGDADPSLTYSASPALVAGDAFTGALARAVGENVGTYPINQGTLDAGSNYSITFAGNTFTIGQKAITVTPEAQSKVYGAADPALTYTFTPALVGADAFTGSLTRTAGENVGAYPITHGTLTAGANYVLTFTANNLDITPKAITVTADAKAKNYGDADPTLTYTTSAPLVGADAFTGALTRDPGENIGLYAIRQGTLDAGTNYTLTYVGADLNIGVKTITVTADAKTKVYGDADPALTYTFTPALTGTDAFTGALTRDAGENAGTYAIKQGTLALNSNYTLVYNGDNLTISPKAITVTADAKTKVYGDADPAFTYTNSPALTGTDAFTGSLARTAGENVGAYPINIGSLAAGANYTLTYVGADITITKKAVNVTAEPKQKTYGDADPTLTYTFNPALVAGDAFTGSLARTAGENVGTYPINIGTLAVNGNYDITFTSADLTIGAKDIDVTATATGKTYGDADPVLTYTAAQSLVGTDAFSGTLTRTPGENVGVYPILQGTLSLGTNYTIHFTGADFTITKKTITVTADPKNKTYGDADPALTYFATPALVGTDVFTGVLTRDAGENVGTYAIKQGTLSLSSNYDLVYNGDNLTIGAKAITVTADAKSKVYGDADPALTYTVTPALVGTDAFIGSLARNAGENVGTYPINQGSLTAGTNYVITYTGNNFTITKKTVNVTADPKQKKYGDADPVLTYTVAPALVAGDTFTGSLSRTAGENVGNYPINMGTLALNANYDVTFTGADLTIGAKDIDVTATATGKTYGDADPVLTYTVAQSLVGGDAFTGTLTRTPGENVGVYPILQGTLSLGNNYTIHFTSADFTITKKTITITMDAAAKLYGDPDPSYSYSVIPALLPGDSFTGALTRDPGENVGTYAIRQGTLSAGNNYNIVFVSADLTIGKRPITVAAKPATKVYGAADPVLGYQITAGSLVTGDAFTGTLTRDPGENVGNYTIRQGTLTPGNNYLVTYIVNVFTITPATLDVAADAQTKVYGTADPVLTYKATGLQLTDDNSVFTGTLTRDLGENVGTYAILQGSLAAGNNYTIVFTGNNLTITKASQTITWSQQLVSGCGGANQIQLNATSSSGLPVTYTVTNTAVATVSGDILTPVAEGGTVVTATQAGDANHEAATPVDNNFAYQLSGLVRPHWDDVLVFDNSSNDYVKWQWYKDGSAINGATMAYYGQSTSLSGTYYVVVTDKSGNTSQTCPLTVTAPATAGGGIKIQPNPAPAGSTATITCNYSDAALQGAKLTITSITGSVLKTVTEVHPSIQVSMPNTGGLYIITLRLATGQIASVNVMIAD